ncbi:MAG: CapA family protein [Lachnospiraceae bacterium]|nr:CapA family protein [Lachnospiraceae bacterium]
MRKILKILMLLAMLFPLASCQTPAKEKEEPLVSEAKGETNAITEEKEEEPVAPPAPVTTTVKMSVVGDIMVHSYQYEDAYDAKTKTYDFSHNFADVKKYFDASDITVGNLETVFAGEEAGIGDYPMFNTPDAFAYTLKDAGFDLFTTANNHCMDRYKSGASRTIDLLNTLGIDHIGTYKTKEERDKILVKEINGISFAFLSYTYGTNGISVPDDFFVNIIDAEVIKSDISAAKATGADFIVVMPHMGNEYETYVKDVFKNWANLMFEAGADIILASHPHVLQPMEMRDITLEDGSTRKGFIIYSLGNFISSQTTPPRNAGIILNMEFEKTEGKTAFIKNISFIPIWTQFRNAQNTNHFVVRSVYEMLTLSDEEKLKTLRTQDVTRLKEIHSEVTDTFFDYETPLSDIKNSYIFYEDGEETEN